VRERSELAADVEEVEDADDEDGDDETVEDSPVGDETRHETNCEASEEQSYDEWVDDVPHVTVEHSELLTELGRLTDKELPQTSNRTDI